MNWEWEYISIGVLFEIGVGPRGFYSFCVRIWPRLWSWPRVFRGSERGIKIGPIEIGIEHEA